SHSKKLSLVLEKEPADKPKRAKKPAKKSTIVPTAGVVIKDTPGVSVSKKKAPTKADKGKGIDLLSEASLLKAAQLKKTLKKSKLKLTSFMQVAQVMELVPNQRYQSEIEHESWGDSDDNSNDNDSYDVTNDDDDDVDSDVDGDNEASDSEKTNFDEDENPNLNQKEDKEEYKEEYVRTLDNYEFFDDEEEYEELYKDVNVRLKDAKHEEEGKGDVEMTDAGRGDVVSIMNVKVIHEEPSTQTPSFLIIPVIVIPKTSTVVAPIIPPTIPPITHLPQQSTPTPTPTPTTTSIPALLDFSSLFAFNQRVFALEKVEKKAKGDKKRYIDLVEKSAKVIIKDEVKSQLPQILPKEVSD
ncbi:hypothetical protein Tco_1519728, partial [Tanacetum coccineum]